MQDRPSAFARFLGRPPKTLDWVLLSSLASVLVLICACGTCVYQSALARVGSRGTTTTTLQAQATATATATSSPKATDIPTGLITDPVLGGTKESFTHAFGPPTNDRNGGGRYSLVDNGTGIFMDISSGGWY